LASRTEGLPRAMVEAMARGLPCIGTAVGGIPELLDAEDLVPPHDADALAARIEEFLETPVRANASAARNLEKSRAYSASALQVRQAAFLEAVRDRTLAWLQHSRRANPEVVGAAGSAD